MTNGENRPSKSERTRAAILAAARELFGAHGYDRTTVRDIAARAGIDPAMVIRYFGSKDELFARTAAFDLRLPDFREVEGKDLGTTIVRHFLSVWEGEGSTGAFTVLLRSASNPIAADRLREVFGRQVAPALATLAGGMDSAAQAGLVTSQLLGLALCRYVLKVPPVVAMPCEQVVQEVGATIQRYLAR